jgi:nitrite reductase/ring-hydroxylating ferredoxin subunit
MSGAAGWVRVASTKQVATGQAFACKVGKREIAVYHLDDGNWAATDNICSHAFALLSEGWLEGTEIECPLHAARFDVTSGKALCAPADKPVQVYPVKVEGKDVLVQIPG